MRKQIHKELWAQTSPETISHAYIRNLTKLKENKQTKKLKKKNKNPPHLSQGSQNNKVIVKLKDTGIPFTHFPWHNKSSHNKMQGSVVRKQVTAVPLFCTYETKWPKLLFQSEALFVPNIQMQQLFFFSFSFLLFF